MESEKEAVEASNKQEGEEGSPKAEEKGSIKDVAGCFEAEKLEEKEGIGETKQEPEKTGENQEMKEEGGNAGEDEEVKEEEENEKGEEEEENKKGGAEEEDVAEGESGGKEDDIEEREEKEIGKKSVIPKSRKKRTIGASELSSPKTPGSDRPARERKTVERFTVNESARSSTPKPLSIEKGQGTQLRDIPNVAFKLSKRKSDENLHLLHTILFGKKAKVHNLKKNIGLFSGFVWTENEEKQRAKIKEKLDKCVKEKLLDFCDILNISVNKATVRKEELLGKLLEFLESPHVTSDILLSQEEKGKKRKRNGPAIKSPGSSNLAGGKYTKNKKLDSESGKKRKHSNEENDDKSEQSQSEEDRDDDDKVRREETEDKQNELGEETGEEQGVSTTKLVETSSKKSAKKDSGRTVEKSAGKKGPAKDLNAPAKTESKSKQKATSTKKQKSENKSEVDASTPAKAKASSKSSTKVLKKDQEGKRSKKAKKEPTREEMHSVVVNILKEVDFNTATLSDILKQLGNHFGVDLLHRKSEVKEIITDVIKNMSSDEDDDASESGNESGDDGEEDEA